MSTCTSCFDAGLIPRCIDQLTIAETDLIDDTDIDVWYELKATGRQEIIEASVIGGIIILNNPVKFPTATPIVLWAVESGDQQNEFIELKFGSEVFTCIEFSVIPKSPEVEFYDFTIVE